jgi:hypothetical protein
MPKAKRTGGDNDYKETKRFRVTRACTNCQRAHIQCQQVMRPCQRCIEKGLADQCVDAEQRKRGKKKQNPSAPAEAAFSHDWFNPQTPFETPSTASLDWNAVAASLPKGTGVSDGARDPNSMEYTFLRFDPDTGEYVDETSTESLTGDLTRRCYWTDTSISPIRSHLSTPMTFSPMGVSRRPSFSDGLHVDAPMDVDANDRSFFRTSLDYGDQRRSSVDSQSSWGHMQLEVEAAHQHGIFPPSPRLSFGTLPFPPPLAPLSPSSSSDRRSSFSFLPPLRPACASSTLGVNDASFLLWRLSHEPDDHHEEHHAQS